MNDITFNESIELEVADDQVDEDLEWNPAHTSEADRIALLFGVQEEFEPYEL